MAEAIKLTKEQIAQIEADEKAKGNALSSRLTRADEQRHANARTKSDTQHKVQKQWGIK